MSPEWLGVIFTAGTFVVITVSAIAAVAQLRHLRSGYQTSGLLTIMNLWQDPKFQSVYQTMQSNPKLADPEYLKAFTQSGGHSREDHPELLVCDFWEQIGTFVKFDLFDERALLDIAASQIIRAWNAANPIISRARVRGGLAAFENFEYIAVRAEQWVLAHPDGAYPKGVPRWTDLPQRVER